MIRLIAPRRHSCKKGAARKIVPGGALFMENKL